jgi:hypothetical protein
MAAWIADRAISKQNAKGRGASRALFVASLARAPPSDRRPPSRPMAEPVEFIHIPL